MRAKCPSCGRIVGAHVPRLGDGSGIQIRSHTLPDGGNRLCHGHRLIDAVHTVDEEATR